MMIWINGKQSEQIAVMDRGLQYGDGVWETLLIKHHQAQFWQAHLARLQRGLQVLAIPFSADDLCVLEQTVQRCLAIKSTGVLKIVVTRGVGGRGYQPPASATPQHIVSWHPLPDYPAAYRQAGVDVMLCQTRLGHQPQLAGFKHLNRLEQVLARREVVAPFAEGLVRDYNDHIIEGTMSNLFIVTDHAVFTPDLALCGIKGIIRQAVIDALAQQKIEIKVSSSITIAQLYQAEALFLTNSVIGIWSVKSFNDKKYKIPSFLQALRERLDL
ncbi:MAG: aminodeoxychorismate lyase [bacterium]